MGVTGHLKKVKKGSLLGRDLAPISLPIAADVWRLQTSGCGLCETRWGHNGELGMWGKEGGLQRGGTRRSTWWIELDMALVIRWGVD